MDRWAIFIYLLAVILGIIWIATALIIMMGGK